MQELRQKEKKYEKFKLLFYNHNKINHYKLGFKYNLIGCTRLL